MNEQMLLLLGSPKTLTLKDVAARYNVDPRTIRRWWKDGEFPAPIAHGRTQRWSMLSLMKYEAEQAGTELSFGSPGTRSIQC